MVEDYEYNSEWLGSGCCEPELWDENGANCPSCK